MVGRESVTDTLLNSPNSADSVLCDGHEFLRWSASHVLFVIRSHLLPRAHARCWKYAIRYCPTGYVMRLVEAIMMKGIGQTPQADQRSDIGVGEGLLPYDDVVRGGERR